MVKYKFSEKDSRGVLCVDCTECKKGSKGDKSCSSGARIKKGHQGNCFKGELLEKFKDVKKVEFGLSFGIVCDDIHDQIKEQGFEYLYVGDIKKNQEFDTYLHHLKFADLVTDSQLQIIRKKLVSKISKQIKYVGKEAQNESL